MTGIEGDGWTIVQANPPVWAELYDIDHLLGDAEWFWRRGEQVCVAGCCGLDAFDFSENAVPLARDSAMEAAELSTRFRHTARVLRGRATELVKSTRLNDLQTAGSFADLFDHLAATLAAE